jgi:hypothetical protein
MAMVSEGRKVTAGTLMPHQPIRRTIPASEINQWIGEEETAVCTENLIRVDDVMESPKLAE